MGTAATALFSLAVLNPTSAVAHLPELRSLNVDAAILAETSLTKGGQKHASAELAKGDKGYNAVWSAPQRPGGCSRSGTRSQGGRGPLPGVLSLSRGLRPLFHSKNWSTRESPTSWRRGGSVPFNSGRFDQKP